MIASNSGGNDNLPVLKFIAQCDFINSSTPMGENEFPITQVFLSAVKAIL